MATEQPVHDSTAVGQRLEDLENLLATALEKVSVLEDRLGRLEKSNVVVIENHGDWPDTLDLEQAKRLIKAFFTERHGENLDYEDIIRALKLPLPLVVEAGAILEREGRLAAVD